MTSLRKDENGRYVDDAPFDHNVYLDKQLSKMNKRLDNAKGSSKIFSRVFWLMILLIGLMLTGVFSPNTSNSPLFRDNPNDNYTMEQDLDLSFSVTIYSSETCSCCHGYASYLEENGVTVNLITDQDYLAVKDDNGIPEDLRSCHTTLVAGFFSEGHIPVTVINNMLGGSFDFDGIALSGMPAGSPGMGGTKDSTWNIYSITNGTQSGVFTSI